jgi:hypothetical protein
MYAFKYMTHLAANAANALSSGKTSYKRVGAGRESKNDAMIGYTTLNACLQRV